MKEVPIEFRLDFEKTLTRLEPSELKAIKDFSNLGVRFGVDFNPKIYKISTFNIKNNKIISLTILDSEVSKVHDSIENLKDLTTIDIFNTQIETLPHTIKELSNLSSLNLSNNQISYLPESFGNLVNLIKLRLGNNPINTLPSSFKNLKQLQNLEIDVNKRFEFDNEIFNNLTSLTQVHLNFNNSTEIPESIGNLKYIETLTLKGVKITSITNSLLKCKKLSGLYLETLKSKRLPKILLDLDSLIVVGLSGAIAENLVFGYKRDKQSDYIKRELEKKDIQMIIP